MVSSYFEPTNYNDPIKYFLENAYYYLSPTTTVYVNSYFSKNLLTLSDNIFGFFDSIV
jgi:hypothetical protein